MKTLFGARMAALVAVGALAALAACAPYGSGPPQQVAAKNPSVSYTYRNDDQLLQARQNANGYCGQYQSSPTSGTTSRNSDGTFTVTFDCIRSGAQTSAIITPPPSNNISYTYLSDNEYQQVAQNAESYCMKYGWRTVSSNSITNPNGSRTVTFVCGPR